MSASPSEPTWSGDFARELARFGPSWWRANQLASNGAKPASSSENNQHHLATPTITLAGAQRYCRQLALGHYENFPVLSVAVPKHLHQAFADVYAYCRWSDDLADEVSDHTLSLQLLDWWEDELKRAFDTSSISTHPVMIALEHSAKQHQLEIEPFQRLLWAFRQDQIKQRYETTDDLLAYCHGSANPVGQIVLRLLGKDTPENIKLSNDVCTGLQLINFWQDVARDADIGRIYLPRADVKKHGVTEAQILSKQYSVEFANLLAEKVAQAEQLLQAGSTLTRHLSGRSKLMISMFAQGGLEIARQIRRQQFDVFAHRPKLSKFRVSQVLGRSLMALMRS